jgi:tetratricopeptide (TPR) repeat protein
LAVSWAAEYLGTAALRRQIPRVTFQDVHRDVAAAIQAASDTVQRNPRAGEPWGRLGMVFHAHEYYAEAITCYRVAGRLDPLEFRWPYYLANLLETDDRSAALVAYRQAIEIQPQIAQLRIRLAELFLDLGRLDDAERELTSAIQLAPQNNQAQYRLAQVLLQRGNPARSLEWATKAAAYQPPRREIHELLAQLYRRLGQSDKSTEQATLLRTAAFASGYWPDPYFEELKRLRRDPLWLGYQAQLLLHQGQSAEALAILEALVQDRPDDAAVCDQLARSLIHVGLLDRAAEVLEPAIQNLPQAHELRRLRAVVHLLQQEWQPAADRFQESLALKQDDAKGHQDLGYCLAQLQQTERAEAEFGEAIRLQPADIAPRVELVRLFLQQARYDEAQAELRLINELSPNNAQAAELGKLIRAPAPAKGN